MRMRRSLMKQYHLRKRNVRKDNEGGTVVEYADAVESAYTELAPHRIRQYIYELSEAFNHFYHETKILAEENGKRKASYLKLIGLVQRVLEQCIYLLGFEAPDKM